MSKLKVKRCLYPGDVPGEDGGPQYIVVYVMTARAGADDESKKWSPEAWVVDCRIADRYQPEGEFKDDFEWDNARLQLWLDQWLAYHEGGTDERGPIISRLVDASQWPPARTCAGSASSVSEAARLVGEICATCGNGAPRTEDGEVFEVFCRLDPGTRDCAPEHYCGDWVPRKDGT